MRRMIVLTTLLVTVTHGRAALAQTPTSDPLAQVVRESETIATGPADLDHGHIDLGPRFVDGRIRLLLRDDTTEQAVWREPDDAVILVRDTASVTVPDDPAYAFVGADAGEPVHVLPQVQRTDVAWLGWNTQDPEVTRRVDRGATLTLLGVAGPGRLTVFLQAGDLTGPDLLWDSTRQTRQRLWVDVNTHTHANWAFSEPGVYLVAVELRAEGTDGTTLVDTTTLRFAVGDSTDPDRARDRQRTVSTAPPTTARPPAGDPGSPRGTAAPVLALVAVGFVVLVVAALVVATRGRRAREVARSSAASSSGDAR